jgi:hypothetical protein
MKLMAKETTLHRRVILAGVIGLIHWMLPVKNLSQ